MALKGAILIAGPTASGKSSLATYLASKAGGVVVNTDSMQVYSVLDKLTARPGPQELAAVPHRLYGYVDPGDEYSTGHWMRDVRALAESGEFDHRRPVFCGGTGLYFRALLEGLSAMPDIPAEIRTRWRYKLTEEGPERLHRILFHEDPDVAMRLKPFDGQRIARALEVLEASGRSILAWQAERGVPLVDKASSVLILLEPDRVEIDRRISARLEVMLQDGAVDEVRRILARNLDPAKPAMRAIGVNAIAALINGDASASETTEKIRIASRQYAKRQSTWFRNQFGPEWQKISDSAEIIDLAQADLDRLLRPN